MTYAARALAPLLLLGAMACNPPPTHGPGGACRSLSECWPGLVCDDGRCTADLSGLAAQTDPPPFTRRVDAGLPAAADAAPALDGAAAMGEGGSTPLPAPTSDAGQGDGG